MKTLTRDTAKLYIIFSILFITSLGVYLNFQNYQPKILRQLQEVKGMSTQREYIPYPRDSVKIGSSKSNESNQLTFETKKTPKELQEFYKNIYLDKGWKIESEGINENFYVLEFKKDSSLITILSSKEKEDDYTVASVEITKR